MPLDGATVDPDQHHLDALVEFARIEMASADVEPWADIIGWLYRAGHLTREEAHWVVALYNTHDSLGSAFTSLRWWPTPYHWANAEPDDRARANDLEITNERRNLRGGKIVRRHWSYVAALSGQSQHAWVTSALVHDDVAANFRELTAWMRQVWGVGRQSAFEWAEFVGKCIDLPVDAGDAQLWESEGPRRSLQRLYGNPRPTPAWLDARAHECKQLLADAGVPLDWWDFETIICDFNVMRDGRYYPGRHLAAIREEIDACHPDDQPMLMEAWAAVVPAEWQSIAPGIDPDKMPVFRDTGRIIDEP